MGSGTIIIGAGHAGVQAAASLRQEGYADPILLLCSEAELPYHKPPLSKAFLKMPEGRGQPLRAESFYTSNDIELRRGVRVDTIEPLSRRVILAGGRIEPFDKLVLATGAKPRKLLIRGADLAGVVELRVMADAGRLRALMPDVRNVVIIGGGFIGLELAATLSGLGKTVSVVELSPRVLGRAVSYVVSTHVQRALEMKGVRFELNQAVAAINGADGKVISLTLASGTEIAADMVVSSIGVEPSCELATAAGIACDNGILVDASMRTSHPGILAIGDCARFPHHLTNQRIRLESVQAATDQAKLAARTILGHEETYTALPWFWSDIGEVKLQMVGLSIGADRQVVGPSEADGAFSIYHFAGPKLVSIDSVNRPSDHLLGRKMLAAAFPLAPRDIETRTVGDAFARWQARVSATSETKKIA